MPEYSDVSESGVKSFNWKHLWLCSLVLSERLLVVFVCELQCLEKQEYVPTVYCCGLWGRHLIGYRQVYVENKNAFANRATAGESQKATNKCVASTNKCVAMFAIIETDRTPQWMGKTYLPHKKKSFRR